MKMTKLVRLTVSVLLVVSLGVVLGCPAPTEPTPTEPTPTEPTPGPEVVYLTMGSTSSTSGLYAWCVAGARVMNKANPGIEVTVVETGAALDNLRRIREGTFDFAFCIDVPSGMQMYNGLDTFEGEAWKDLRFLLFRNACYDRLYVRADAGITTFGDLAGKRFSPGIPGSSSAAYVMKFNDVLGTGIDLVPGALGDSIKALKEGRIVGLQKSSSPDSFDAALMECHLTTPLTVIGYSEEDVAKIQARYPYMVFAEVPAGGIKELPELGMVREETCLVGAFTSTRMSEDVVYRLVKAYAEGFDEVAAAYPAIIGWDPVADFFRLVPPGGEVPAHPGLIRYAKELGIEVEDRFIPPEYQGP